MFNFMFQVVDAVSAIPSKQYPKWFVSFKTDCHPATNIGLIKHLVRNDGFLKLLVDFTIKTKLHQVNKNILQWSSVMVANS